MSDVPLYAWGVWGHVPGRGGGAARAGQRGLAVGLVPRGHLDGGGYVCECVRDSFLAGVERESVWESFVAGV